MEATKSIAAALQSEHGLDDETSDLDGQLESVRFNQVNHLQKFGNPQRGNTQLYATLFASLASDPAFKIDNAMHVANQKGYNFHKAAM